jgi:hypothetical protein
MAHSVRIYKCKSVLISLALPLIGAIAPISDNKVILMKLVVDFSISLRIPGKRLGNRTESGPLPRSRIRGSGKAGYSHLRIHFMGAGCREPIKSVKWIEPTGEMNVTGDFPAR